MITDFSLESRLKWNPKKWPQVTMTEELWLANKERKWPFPTHISIFNPESSTVAALTPKLWPTLKKVSPPCCVNQPLVVSTSTNFQHIVLPPHLISHHPGSISCWCWSDEWQRNSWRFRMYLHYRWYSHQLSRHLPNNACVSCWRGEIFSLLR